MSTRLPLYRMLNAPLSQGNDSVVSFSFRADSYFDPGVKALAQYQYAIGKDSDWNPGEHTLVVQCVIERIPLLEAIFGAEGVVTAESEVLLALEWASADSCWRTLGTAYGLQHVTEDGYVVLEITLKPGTVRGSGLISVQTFLGRHTSEFVPGYAHQLGARLGLVTQPIEIIIDGDGSLFPVLEESLGPTEPLWELKACWSDPQDEPFSSEYVALVLNSSHPHFDQLRDRRALSIEQSQLMRQVFAAWLTLVIAQVKEDMGAEFDTHLGVTDADEGIGSIADAICSFIRLGDLDTGSLPELFKSIQRWIDSRVMELEAAK
ncbi:hypothetical protein GKN89_13490 [Serratia sp. YC16]|uniref:hypothetical protein n=1 Tax=Serratia sp. YC16 TaxID=2675312 RepID=UPI0012BA13FB|nr:hypothetical protein [Serratia sp. YC16]MTD07743.1 hypothetical protein [Serratia sp. YC16]